MKLMTADLAIISAVPPTSGLAPQDIDEAVQDAITQTQHVISTILVRLTFDPGRNTTKPQNHFSEAVIDSMFNTPGYMTCLINAC